MLRISISHSKPLVAIHGNATAIWLDDLPSYFDLQRESSGISQPVMFDFSDSNHCSVVLVSTIHYDSPFIAIHY